MVRVGWDTSNLAVLWDAPNALVYKACCGECITHDQSCGADCGSTGPSDIWVTLAGFEDCVCTDYKGPLQNCVADTRSGKGTGFAAGLEGIFWLTGIDSGGEPGIFNSCSQEGCAFMTNFNRNSQYDDYEGTYGTREIWLSTGCSGPADFTTVYNRLRVQVCLVVGGFVVIVYVVKSTDTPNADHRIFTGSAIYLGGETCGDTDEAATNNFACISDLCPAFEVFQGVSGGTAKIYVGDPCDSAPEWDGEVQYFAHDFVIDAVNGDCFMARNDVLGGGHPATNPTDWLEI